MGGLTFLRKGRIEKNNKIKIVHFMKEANIFRELVDHSLIGKR